MDIKQKVDDLLKEKGYVVYTISSDGRLKDAVKVLNEKYIGALIVINDEEEILGIITERDILRKLGRTEGEIKDINVKFVMTPREELIVGTPDDSVEYLMKVMTSNRIRHIPIVEGEDSPKMKGLISIGDVVKAHLGDLEHEDRHLVDFIQGALSI